jgi:hypothetical protein
VSKESIHAEPEAVAEVKPEHPGAPECCRADRPTTMIRAAVLGGLPIAELAALDVRQLALLATVGC